MRLPDRLRPDREYTATGYVWLDKLTYPIWSLRMWWTERSLLKRVGHGDVEVGRRIMTRVFEEHRHPSL